MTLRFPMILVLVGAVISVVTGRSHAPTPTGMPRDRPAALTEHQVLEQFAAAYVRLLDGRLEAQQLPDATTAVRALARQAGAVPAGRATRPPRGHQPAPRDVGQPLLLPHRPGRRPHLLRAADACSPREPVARRRAHPA